MKLRGRIGALQFPDVTDVEETGCSGQSGLLCPDGAGRPSDHEDQSVAFPLPEIYDFRSAIIWTFFIFQCIVFLAFRFVSKVTCR